MDWHTFTAADAFAISMLGVMSMGMAVVGGMFFCMRRNAARRNPDVDSLLDEVEAAEREVPVAKPVTEEQKKPQEPGKAWEQDGDWWKS